MNRHIADLVLVRIQDNVAIALQKVIQSHFAQSVLPPHTLTLCDEVWEEIMSVFPDDVIIDQAVYYYKIECPAKFC